MDFYDLVNKRRMVRNFSADPVDPAIIERVLEAAKHGPSAGFTQGQDFIVVTDDAMKQRLADFCGEAEYIAMGFDPFISKAPVLIIPCTNEAAYHRRYQQPDKVNESGEEIVWPVPYWFMDAGHAVMLLLLAVVYEGLAAGFAGFQDLDAARDTLGIPEEVTPVGLIPIGHPAPDKRSPSLKRGRRPTTDTVHRERW
ncbi:MAG: nitroreductase family protein [Chloroflexi bacterium]|nr:nitroreductase family protein [Chloroflexota bacterium]